MKRLQWNDDAAMRGMSRSRALPQRSFASIVASLALAAALCASLSPADAQARDGGERIDAKVDAKMDAHTDAQSERKLDLVGEASRRARTIETRMPIPDLAPEGVRVRVFLPPDYDPNRAIGYDTLYINDGQDADALALPLALDAMRLNADTDTDAAADAPVALVNQAIRPLIAIAIDAPKQRMAAYGFSDRDAARSRVAQSRYGPVGAQAHAYSQWLANTLVPAIDARYRTRARPESRAILGWSLGAANALDLGWQYPEVFGRVGAFSPSLWLAEDRSDPDAAQRTRIAQNMIANGGYHAGSRFFFAVGDAEETDDRDRDGSVDALDDTRDLLDGWRERAEAEPRLKGLRQLGHSVHLDHAERATRADAALYVLRGGRHEQASWAKMLPVFLAWAYGLQAPALNATGATESWQDVPSQHVAARNVDVWLPPSYGRDETRRYPVLYMHDGQNLFDPALSYTGTDWDIDGAMTRLIERGEIREAIVVGIWNTPLRFAEYMPRAPVTGDSIASGIPQRPAGRAADVVSDAYLRFLVEELKPMIDARYRTQPGRDDTLIMGSSMGGLISLYALARHPQVFGALGAVSTHWPICDGCVVDWLRQALPAPGAHRLYFDYGTATLDAHYPPYQAKMDAAMRKRGYREGVDWTTRRFEGAEHNEAAWKARIEIPLRFLLSAPNP